MAPGVDALRVQGRGEVEGAGQRCAPVHEQGAHLIVVGVQSDAPDVAAVQGAAVAAGAVVGDRILRVGVLHVDASEEETDLGGGVLGEALGDLVGLVVAFEQCLRVVDVRGEPLDSAGPVGEAFAGGVDMGEQLIEPVLFLGDGGKGREGRVGVVGHDLQV